MTAADAHSDLLLELVFAEHQIGEDNPFRARWLDPLERGEVALQVCAIYVEPDLDPGPGLREALRQARSFARAVDGNADRVVSVRAAADLDGLGKDRIGLLLSLEGASALGSDPWLIDVFAELGVRMASLTWNERNAFASGCHEQGGVTPLGARLVDRMLDLGMAIDLAHASPRTFHDVLEHDCDGRVLVSHAACRALRDHPRNLGDDQLAALAQRDGVLGLMPHPLVVDPDEPTVERFIAHAEHAVSVMGIDHVALGGDFLRQIMRALGEADQLEDGMPADAAIEGLAGPQDYPALADTLRRRGWDDDAVSALCSGNLFRVVARSLPR